MSDLSKLCIHSITTKPWGLREAAAKYAAAGVSGISVWQDAAAAAGDSLKATGDMIRGEGVDVVCYVRGGFFTALEGASRTKAIDENKRIIDEASEMGAPLVVLVCGATPGQSLFESRKQIADGIAASLDHAASAGVKLGIEPLHPMYADSRSAVNTMTQANEICDAIDHPNLGITVDVFHTWWDDRLEGELKIAGAKNRIFSFHICDWKNLPEDMLNDRGLMGEGVIDVAGIRRWVHEAGFSGYEEVEIFSSKYWAMDQDEYLANIKAAYIALD
ncbi:MAG: xylose isomerase [Opitutales bacterium TMED158]|nr:MAG: xylose isomerase [Opitutales bacterium TMED158]